MTKEHRNTTWLTLRKILSASFIVCIVITSPDYMRSRMNEKYIDCLPEIDTSYSLPTTTGTLTNLWESYTFSGNMIRVARDPVDHNRYLVCMDAIDARLGVRLRFNHDHYRGQDLLDSTYNVRFITCDSLPPDKVKESLFDNYCYIRDSSYEVQLHAYTYHLQFSMSLKYHGLYYSFRGYIHHLWLPY